MKAIILNSGTASRMGKLVEDRPKCLLEVRGNETVLGLQLRSLRDSGVEGIIITTGSLEGKIEYFVKENFPDLNVHYVRNPLYSSTNYIYSLYLAQEKIREEEEDTLLLHGDLVFDDEVLHKIISHKHNGVLLDRTIPLPEKDFKGRVEGGLVKEIGIHVSGDNCHFLAPLYKFSSKSFNLWLEEIERFVIRGETKVYAENAFNKISDQLEVGPVFYDGHFCMEIDTPDDLHKARCYFND